MQYMSRVGVLVVLLVLVGVPVWAAHAQDDPAWVTYSGEASGLTFEVPAAWAVTNDAEYGVSLASDPAVADQNDDLAMGYMVGGINSPAFVADRLATRGLTPADDLMAQARALTDHPDHNYAYLWLDDDTILAVDYNGTGPFERASIVQRVGGAATVVVSSMTHHGQLVWFLDDLITLIQSIRVNVPPDAVAAAPDGNLPTLDETYVTLDEVMAIHHPAEWAVHMFNPGTILFGNTQAAVERLIERGQVNREDTLFALVTPFVVAALMGDDLTPDTVPEEALAFFMEYSNATDTYGDIETVMVGDYPAARAFMAQHHFQVVTYVVQLAPDQFAMFDLMVDIDAFDQHQPLLEAIMASAEVLG